GLMLTNDLIVQHQLAASNCLVAQGIMEIPQQQIFCRSSSMIARVDVDERFNCATPVSRNNRLGKSSGGHWVTELLAD
ncbi:threonylcarbamoyl-AMP synthase, partial [Weissella cibaria]|nr:threonylcarbamoyl-AMP synthase [Weissella cibaria]